MRIVCNFVLVLFNIYRVYRRSRKSIFILEIAACCKQ